MSRPVPSREAIGRLINRPAVVAAGVWTSIYLLLWATGQRFSTQYLDIAWQLIPVETLRADPLGSVWHLHIQPPLWNLLVGGVLAWSPLPDSISLQIIQFVFGVVGVALLASLLARLFARRVVGVVIATLVMLDPQVLANAFTPTYELATTCGLIAVLWLVVVQPRSPSFTLVSLAAVGTAVVMTRTVFHPAWLALLLLVSWWVVRRSVDTRTIVLTVAMPLILVGGWMVKNEVMFDRPTLSSWFGMNLQRAVAPLATDEQLGSWAAAGGISEITAAHPSGFVSYSAYEPLIGECVPKGDHAATNDLTRDGPLAISQLQCRLLPAGLRHCPGRRDVDHRQPSIAVSRGSLVGRTCLGDGSAAAAAGDLCDLRRGASRVPRRATGTAIVASVDPHR